MRKTTHRPDVTTSGERSATIGAVQEVQAGTDCGRDAQRFHSTEPDTVSLTKAMHRGSCEALDERGCGCAYDAEPMPPPPPHLRR
eukprot:SAG11_NODE_9890_length_872_cov_0.976714_1_plen_85_part_00